jgi:DNA repair metallo-beta-lactamase
MNTIISSYNARHSFTISNHGTTQSVAEHFGLRVYVDASRHRVLSALNWPKERMKIFTTCKEEACIWVVPFGKINMKSMAEYFALANTKAFATQYDHICGYRPTGWSMSSKPSSAAGKNCVSSRKNGNLSIHSVPYSEHSSFPELVDCLKCLRPISIIPTVSTSKSDEQVDTLLNGLRSKQTTLNFSP